MTSVVFAAMLASALLHATWNGWVKSRPDPYGALIALGIGAAWPNLILLAWNGLPAHAAWGWIALTIGSACPRKHCSAVPTARETLRSPIRSFAA